MIPPMPAEVKLNQVGVVGGAFVLLLFITRRGMCLASAVEDCVQYPLCGKELEVRHSSAPRDQENGKGDWNS